MEIIAFHDIISFATLASIAKKKSLAKLAENKKKYYFNFNKPELYKL